MMWNSHKNELEQVSLELSTADDSKFPIKYLGQPRFHNEKVTKCLKISLVNFKIWIPQNMV